jgi:hypothetical protein
VAPRRVELADDQHPHVLVRQLAEQQLEGPLVIAGVERRDRLGAASGLVQPDPRPQAVDLEVLREAPRAGASLVVAAVRAGSAPARRRRRRAAGSSASARRSDCSSPAAASSSASLGTTASKKLSTTAARLGPDELLDHHAVAERLDRRNALNAERLRQRRVGVRVDLGQHDRALAGAGGVFEQRRQRAARAAPRAQKSTTTGVVRERSITSTSKSASLTSTTVIGTAYEIASCARHHGVTHVVRTRRQSLAYERTARDRRSSGCTA